MNEGHRAARAWQRQPAGAVAASGSGDSRAAGSSGTARAQVWLLLRNGPVG